MPAVLDAPDVIVREPSAIAAPDQSLAGRSIAHTTRNLVLGAVGLLLLAYFAVQLDALTDSVGLLLAGGLLVIPFAFKQTPAGERRAGESTVAITTHRRGHGRCRAPHAPRLGAQSARRPPARRPETRP